MSLKSSSVSPNTKKKSQSWKFGLGVFLAFSFALGAFVSGMQVGKGAVAYNQTANIFSFFSPEETAAELSGEPDLSEFWKIWELLEDKFAYSSTTDQLTDEELIEGAIDGLVEAYGDPYTLYLPPVESEAFNENISGNFSGVGMEVGLRDGIITVIAPLPETPAQNAGVLAGDVVVKIDDVSTEGMRIDEAVKLIRGEKGTEVVLNVFREGESEFIDISIIRDNIDIPTVKTEQIGDTFIVSLYSFNAIAESEMNKALNEYLKSGADSLVVDLRGNPGGFLQSSVSIASYFLPAGKIVVKEEFGEEVKNEVFRSRGRQIQIFTPENLVVLVDGGSASASEILAGALKDHGVATIMGSQTFGKGSVQELVDLDGGSSLKVTVARWLTPDGVSISDGGLTPDIVINRTNQQRMDEEDPQKDAAVRFLSGEEVVSEVFEDKIVNDDEDDSVEPGE
jgi:carboxyl-terminal processing protease